MPRRSDDPTPHALRVRRCRALRNKGFACAQVPINGDVLNMLIRRGKLADRDVESREAVNKAVADLLLEEAEKW